MKEATRDARGKKQIFLVTRYTRRSREIWRKKYKIRQQSKYSLDTVAFILPTLKIPLKNERCYPILRWVKSFSYPEGDERRKKFNCAIIPHKFFLISPPSNGSPSWTIINISECRRDIMIMVEGWAAGPKKEKNTHNSFAEVTATRRKCGACARKFQVFL